jgi:hypothetical protein
VDDMTDDRNTPSPGTGLDLAVCPECAAPAEVLDRFALSSTDGPVEHVTVVCLGRHRFLLPAASLPAVPSLGTVAGTGPVR